MNTPAATPFDRLLGEISQKRHELESISGHLAQTQAELTSLIDKLPEAAQQHTSPEAIQQHLNAMAKLYFQHVQGAVTSEGESTQNETQSQPEHGTHPNTSVVSEAAVGDEDGRGETPSAVGDAVVTPGDQTAAAAPETGLEAAESGTDMADSHDTNVTEAEPTLPEQAHTATATHSGFSDVDEQLSSMDHPSTTDSHERTQAQPSLQDTLNREKEGDGNSPGIHRSMLSFLSQKRDFD